MMAKPLEVEKLKDNLSDQVFADLARFGRLLFATKDHDPIYYLLYHKVKTLSREQGCWLTVLYLSFYNTMSAWQAFEMFPTPQSVLNSPALFRAWELRNRSVLPCNVERRGLRGGKVVDTIVQLLHAMGFPSQTFEDVLSDGLSDCKEDNYNTLWARLYRLPWVGRWATFKWLDLLQHVNGFPLTCPDMRLAYCSGPRQALEELYCVDEEDRTRQDPAYIQFLDGLAEQLRERLSGTLSLGWDELETLLCNFHSLVEGRYYVGHDWDEHLRDTLRGPLDSQEIWLEARHAVAPSERLLGERMAPGWQGVRKELCKLYKTNHTIFNPIEQR